MKLETSNSYADSQLSLFARSPSHSLSSSPLPSPPEHSPQVQVFEFLKAADLCRQLLDLVIKKVKHFQILQFRCVGWHNYRNKHAECEYRNLTPRKEGWQHSLIFFHMREG